ncbi:MAG TPA: xanthine dehydrogenase family protein molybdopterin-binding subunit, partial [Solirubrobacter sp.]|nr:xanthine dehydrogenase family protein molybdopterin-binding subunit [Solirubrobacter sp.]
MLETTQQPKLFGARVKRREDPRFLTGRATFVDDIVRPRMLHAAFVRSSPAHADVVSVDAGAARSAPGVRAVLTGPEAASLAQPITCDSTFETWQSSRFPALAHERVRFSGEALACVVADDRYLAEDACALVDVEYEPRPVVASMEQALADGAPRLHDDWEDNLFIKRHFKGGDPDPVFEGAHGVVSLDLVSNRHSGIPLENRGCIAEHDPAEGTLTLWTATQIPHLVRTGLADALGFPESRIVVIAPDVGGGFGIKGHLFPEEIAVCLMAMRTGRPVKWIEDRREHMLASIHAREHHHHVEAAYDADGTVLALRARLLIDCGAYSVYPWTATMDTGMALGILPGPYRIRHYECRAFSVATNKCPLGPYRGVARPAAAFSIERVMDEVAHAVGITPAEVRRRNLVRGDEFPYESVTGLIYDSGSFHEALERALEDADEPGLRARQERLRSEGRHLGIGLACYTEQTAHTTKELAKRGVPIIFGYDSATVRMDPSGQVNVMLSTHSHGQGHETTVAQVVAD